LILLFIGWRGGKRSGEICRLVNEAGITARRIYGGYRAYRRGIRACIEQPRKLLILGGKTGSGKTALLLGLRAQGLQVIDLEGLANHKGSVLVTLMKGRNPPRNSLKTNFTKNCNGWILNKPCFLKMRVMLLAQSISHHLYFCKCVRPLC